MRELFKTILIITIMLMELLSCIENNETLLAVIMTVGLVSWTFIFFMELNNYLKEK